MSTRRQWRKNRPKLRAGDTGLKGAVKKGFGKNVFGFVQPSNGAADIIFYFDNVPFNREKCVGEGCEVYFRVVKMTNGRLKAMIL